MKPVQHFACSTLLTLAIICTQNSARAQTISPMAVPSAAQLVQTPRSFRAIFTRTFTDSGQQTHVEQIYSNGAFENAETDTNGPLLVHLLNRYFADAAYEQVDGVWYKTPRLYSGRRPGMYPEAWSGTISQEPDSVIGTLPVNVYHVVDRGASYRIYVGKADRFVRREEVRRDVSVNNNGAYYDERLDIDELNESLAVDRPADPVDASACPYGIQAPKVTVPAFSAPENPKLAKSVTVDVFVAVSIDGRLLRSSIARSSGYPVIDEIALKTVRAATFNAGTAYCRPRASERLVGLEFQPD
jgi:TonB family protein